MWILLRASLATNGQLSSKGGAIWGAVVLASPIT
jgi:hypothetical protein